MISAIKGVLDMDKITEMLFEALVRDDLKAIQSAITSGADVKSTTSAGHSPLHIAAMKCSNSEVFRLLAQCGASINGCDSVGRTPLHWAGLGGNYTIILTLLALGADRTIPDGNGHLPRIRNALDRRAEERRNSDGNPLDAADE